MKDKVVIFIDIVAQKNKLQIETLQQFGYHPYCFVTEIKSASNNYFKKGNQQKLEAGFFKRIWQVIDFFKNNRSSIHHVELYPGGRFSFLYVLLSNFFSLKTICIERGDLLYYRKNGYSVFTRFSMWFCYRFADIVWYRELYMKQKLERIRKTGLFFLHNAIKIHDHNSDSVKDIDFLWLNRVIPERKYKWFLDVLGEPNFASTKNYLVGLLKQSSFSAHQEYVEKNKPSNLQLEYYSSDPFVFFKRAKFFVLPSEVIFANNALLEAMSYGVIPIISQQQGSELIVDNKFNGFIFEHSQKGFQSAMEQAMLLTEEERKKLSANAIKKVKEDFSETRYVASLQQLYKLVD